MNGQHEGHSAIAFSTEGTDRASNFYHALWHISRGKSLPGKTWVHSDDGQRGSNNSVS